MIFKVSLGDREFEPHRIEKASLKKIIRLNNSPVGKYATLVCQRKHDDNIVFLYLNATLFFFMSTTDKLPAYFNPPPDDALLLGDLAKEVEK